MKNNKKAFTLVELSIVLIIIGLIVVGITAGQSLVQVAKVSGAQSLTNTSPVNAIEGLVMWFDTVSDGSIPEAQKVDGGSVTDLVNNNKTLVNSKDAASSGTAPTYDEDGINSLPTLNGAGTGAYLVTTPLNWNNTDFTVFAVASLDSVSSFSRGIVSSRNGAGAAN